MRIILTMCFGFILHSFISAQETLVFMNANGIKENRYEGIEGSPYVFESFLVGDLLHINGSMIQDVTLNINAYEEDIEVQHDGKIIPLEDKVYLSLVIDPTKNPTMQSKMVKRFVKGLIPAAPEKFAEILYDGTHKLLKEYYCNTSKQKIENVGKTIEIERFFLKSNYYLQDLEGNIQLVKLKEKMLTKVLPKDQVATIRKAEKLNLSKEDDLIILLQKIDQGS